MNAVTNNILTITTGIYGIYNIFELNEDYIVDKELMEKDINEYGLYSYEDWDNYLSYDLYYGLNFEFLKISIAKGLTTEEELFENIVWYYRILEEGEIIT